MSTPVTLETSPILGSAKLILCSAFSYAANIGSINGEWKAWDTDNR
jgi:hypothetical protein